MSNKLLSGAKFNIWALALVPTVLLIPRVHSAGVSDEGINAQAYQVLCDIYNVASSPPKTLYDSGEVSELQETVDVINASLAEDDWVEEIGKASTASQLSDSFKKQYGSDEAQFGRWKKAVNALLAPGSEIQKIKAGTHLVNVARIKVAQIEDQFEKIVQRMTAMEKTADLKTIETEFSAVINEEACDKGGNKLCGTKGTRSTKCGAEAGTSNGSGGLVLDFFCLCAKQQSGSTCGTNQYACGKECGVDIAAQQWASNGNGVTSADQIWELLKQGCTKRRLLPERSLEAAGRLAISNFLRELGRVKAAFLGSKKPCGVGILGTIAQGSSACHSQKVDCKGEIDGGTNAEGICINYGTDSTKWEQIQWVSKFTTALGKLKSAEKLNTTIQTELTQLKRLQTRANEIYEETVALLELQKNAPERSSQTQNQHQNPGNPSEKATAQEPVIVGSAKRHSFLLPWALLI